MKKIGLLLIVIMMTGCASKMDQSKDEIKNSIVTMVNAIDTKSWQVAIDQFDDNVFVDYESLSGQPGSEVAATALVGNWEKLLKTVDTHHMLTNFVIKTDGKTAETFTHVYASHIAENIEFWDAYGRYHHKLIKTKDSWKITFMKLIMHGQKGNTNFLQQVSQ